MGERILGGLLVGAGRGIEAFGDRIRKDKLFELQRQKSLVDIRAREMDIARTKQLMSLELKADLREDEAARIRNDINIATLQNKKQVFDHQEKWGDVVKEAALDLTNARTAGAKLDNITAGIRNTLAQIGLDEAIIAQEDNDARRLANPLVDVLGQEKIDREIAQNVRERQEALEVAEHAWNMQLDENGVSNFAKRLKYLADKGAAASEIEVNQAAISTFNRTHQSLFADLRAAIALDDPIKIAVAEQAIGIAMRLELTPEQQVAQAELLAEAAEATTATEVETTGIERGPSPLGSLLGFKPVKAASEKLLGEEESSRIANLRELDEFARKTFFPTLPQTLRDLSPIPGTSPSGSAIPSFIPGGALFALEGPLGRLRRGEVEEDSRFVWQPGKGKVLREDFSFQLNEKDADKILRFNAKENPEEFAKFQQAPLHEQRIQLARAAAQSSELQREIARIIPEGPNVGTIGLQSALAFFGAGGGGEFAKRLGIKAASKIPFLGNLVKSPAARRSFLPKAGPKETIRESFRQPGGSLGSGTTRSAVQSGPLRQLPAPAGPQTKVLPPQPNFILQQPRTFPAAGQRALPAPSQILPPGVQATPQVPPQLSPQEMELLLKALQQTLGGGL